MFIKMVRKNIICIKLMNRNNEKDKKIIYNW